MLTEEKKARIKALTTEEMLYEINLGRKSHFQREKFAYLQTCYQQRVEEERRKQGVQNAKIESLFEKTVYPSSPPTPHPATESAYKEPDDIHNPRFRISPLRIAEGVIVGLLVVCIVYLVYHYLDLNLKP